MLVLFLVIMTWKVLNEQPGIFGEKRGEIFRGYDEKYGKDNWQVRYNCGDKFLDFLSACQIFQDAYLVDSYTNAEAWNRLKEEAWEIYDVDDTDLKSGLDYSVQNGRGVHIQDIAIRNVFHQRVWDFEGDALIQARGDSASELGRMFSPYVVDFHDPDKIVQPSYFSGKKWAGSVEDWMQSCKVLLFRSS